jgi:acyl-CoA thioester hydrolase
MFEQVISPGFSDTDALGHINNTKLPIWFLEARNELFKIFTPDLDPKKWRLILAKIEVEYVGELFYGQDITLRTYIGDIGNASFRVRQEAWQSGLLASKGEAVMVHFNFSEKKAEPLPEDIRQRLVAHQQ